MEQRIEAKGLACPKPVILAKKAMDACGRNDVVLITVDNEMAVENLRKLAASQGAEYASEKLGEKEYSVRITVTGENENKTQTEIPVTCSIPGHSFRNFRNRYCYTMAVPICPVRILSLWKI